TGLMQPCLDQLFGHGSGGVVFDIKGDFHEAVSAIARRHPATPLVIIGPGHRRLNLLAGLSPEMCASFLKSAILLGGYGASESFWIDSATELLRNTFGVLSAVPEYYSLEGAHAYLFDARERERIDAEVLLRAPHLEGRTLRTLRAYQTYHESVFSGFDDKVSAGIRATAAQVLSPFSHPDLIDAFCRPDPGEPFSIEQVLAPAVVLVDLPLAVWGLGAKVVYTLIKLRFFNIMQQRARYADADAGQPTFFMCDEYQEIVSASKDGLSDLNFWDKSRSTRTVGIVSSQSVSSFYAALGNRELANAVLQNFRQKICFRSEDPATLDLVSRVLGRARVRRVTETLTRSGRWGMAAHYSRGRQYQDVEEEVSGAQEIRALGRLEALALLSVAGRSIDDVMTTAPLYLDG
ncbi:MAG: type IV secretory system conjugative DNA transfer family protein, partial [Acidiferrobacteraceae bacterium]